MIRHTMLLCSMHIVPSRQVFKIPKKLSNEPRTEDHVYWLTVDEGRDHNFHRTRPCVYDQDSSYVITIATIFSISSLDLTITMSLQRTVI